MVGKVPLVNNPEVRPNSPPAKYISDRNATAETFGAGIGRAQSALGANLERLGGVLVDHGIRVKEEQNAAEATDLYLKADIALAEKRNAYGSLEGKNAVDALPQYLKDVQQLGDEYAKGASNDRVRRQFAQNFSRQQGFAVSSAGQYAAGQRKRYESGLTQSLRTKAESEAVAYADDDVRFLDAADIADQSVTQQQRQEGWSDEQAALERQKTRSNLWEKRLAALSIKDPIRANDLYNGAKDQIDGISRVRIEQHIETGLIQQGSRKIADGLVGRQKAREAAPRAETPATGEASPELLRAIEQTESGGQPGLTSPKGALGNMQLMPETAKEEARLAGVPYDENRLRDDPEYNRMLGTRVFNRYLASYGGNTTLALAAYNAGPARVNQWLKDYGDPRQGGITEAEWAAKIPFGETRRYLEKIGGKVQIASAEPQVWGDDRDLPTMVRDARAEAERISPGNARFADAAANQTIQRYQEEIKAPKIQRAELEKQAKEAQKAAQEATMNDWMAAAQAGKVDATGIWTRPELKVLDFNQKMQLQNATERMTKPEPMTQVSQGTTTELMDRLRLPDGDPRKITDTGPIYDSLIAGRLKKDDFNFVMKEFNDLRTQGGERLSQTQKDFFEHIKPQIDQSNPLLGKIDQTGKEQMYRYMFDVRRKIEQYRESGKNPYDLFDPSKPDYVGKPEAMKQYQTTINQSIQNFSQGMRAPTNRPPASVTVPLAPALPTGMQRQSGETLEEWRKRTGR